MTPDEIAKLRALAGAATPGPWGWFGNLTTHEVHLATVKRGRVYVMDFVRWGMTGAAPRFQRDHIMERVDKLAVREVPYRGHFNEIDHPDARYIAAACNELPRLCDEIERLRADVAWLRGIVEVARRVAFRGEHTGDCIGASGGACFEDDRDECECGLTALRNVLASYTPAMVVRKGSE